jgi:uncharacterized membrane protein YidH (DUF202 family)
MRQPDLVQQQTALAWGRTSLAAGGFGAAMLRLAALHHSIPDLLVAAGLLLCGLLLAIRGRVLYYQPAKPAGPTLRFVTLVALLIGVLVAVTEAM